ncbi:hypothetical protein [Terribacillus saccharophilus]|uniref:hypothetical protein n=1 Tax=Terribacillus saccharophilus TaxID=361277 RepID=UPI002DCA1799|nr:hypothetical protein [Terribacillus saccharophilus]MEC0288908.1 hypothetical protein [Terribacillus saccharophilus]
MTEFLNKEDLSIYSKAADPNYSIESNGKVDINPVTGDVTHRIGLSVKGMQRLVKDWVSESNGLSLDDKAELIELLSDAGNRYYDNQTKEWKLKS